MANKHRAADRPVVVPHFGKLLTKARGKLPLQEIVRRMWNLTAEQHGFTRPQLERYERGQTPRPDPVVLHYLAQIYGADVREWLAALAAEREQIRLREQAHHPVVHRASVTLESSLSPSAHHERRARGSS